MSKNIPENELVPVLETGIDEILNSDKPVTLFPPGKQENSVPQINNSLVKLQAWCYGWCHSSLNPLVEL